MVSSQPRLQVPFRALLQAALLVVQLAALVAFSVALEVLEARLVLSMV